MPIPEFFLWCFIVINIFRVWLRYHRLHVSGDKYMGIVGTLGMALVLPIILLSHMSIFPLTIPTHGIGISLMVGEGLLLLFGLIGLCNELWKRHRQPNQSGTLWEESKL